MPGCPPPRGRPRPFINPVVAPSLQNGRSGAWASGPARAHGFPFALMGSVCPSHRKGPSFLLKTCPASRPVPRVSGISSPVPPAVSCEAQESPPSPLLSSRPRTTPLAHPARRGPLKHVPPQRHRWPHRHRLSLPWGWLPLCRRGATLVSPLLLSACPGSAPHGSPSHQAHA